jgi:ubiquitin C-terminal hydrolase
LEGGEATGAEDLQAVIKVKPVPGRAAATLVDAVRTDFFETTDQHQIRATTLANLPEVLTFHVDRRIRTETGEATAQRWAMAVPELLELPNDILEDQAQSRNGDPQPRYGLVHVVVHHAFGGGGHYVSFGRLPDGRWYEHNDTTPGERRRVVTDEVKQALLTDGYLYVYQRLQSVS